MHRKTIVSLVVVLCLTWASATVWAGEVYSTPGPAVVGVLSYDWVNQARNRPVPVKIYYPEKSDALPGPYPVIFFSHGLGGSREGYEFLGRQWASRGFVSVHVQHLGSDENVWKGKLRPLKALRGAASDIQNSLDRPNDIKFAITMMDRLNQEPGPLRGLLDMNRIAAAGHSFGAYTTLALAGQVFVEPDGKEITFTEPRLKAVVAMSAPVAAARERPDQAYGSIKIPCLHMTGTKDSSPVGETTVKDRRVPYDHINLADQYLVTFQDGDHMIFSGRERLVGDQDQDQIFHQLILAATTAFWEAYLRDEPKAKAWLTDGGLARALDGHGTLEEKMAAGSK